MNKKDLIVLVADGQQQAVIETLLVKRHQSLNKGLKINLSKN